ncbi:hypothetical protein EVAR_73458_1, partial [Eumeta japonica]
MSQTLPMKVSAVTVANVICLKVVYRRWSTEKEYRTKSSKHFWGAGGVCLLVVPDLAMVVLLVVVQVLVRAGAGNNNAGKKKKRKARGAQSTSHANAKEDTPPPDPIDPDEPTYC